VVVLWICRDAEPASRAPSVRWCDLLKRVGGGWWGSPLPPPEFGGNPRNPRSPIHAETMFIFYFWVKVPQYGIGWT
jgi:hypothetical protein